LCKALKRAGFVHLRQKGSHVSLEKRIGDKVWKTVVPMHSEVAKGTLADILKKACLRWESGENSGPVGTKNPSRINFTVIFHFTGG